MLLARKVLTCSRQPKAFFESVFFIDGAFLSNVLKVSGCVRTPLIPSTHSRGLESHVNRLIQSYPSGVGVDAGGGNSSASLCTPRAGKTGPTAFEVSDGA